MHKGRKRAAGLVVALVAWIVGAAYADDEVERTWSGGRLAYAANGQAIYARVADSLEAAQNALAGRRLAAIVYLHGCSGLDGISEATARFLAGAGYLVIAPDSFARRDKPPSCDVRSHTSGLHRGVLAWRQNEAATAFAHVRALPYVDRTRIFLYGFSEGAIAAATATVSARARVIEGWTCHAAWPEYAGLRGGPTLSLVAADDPWFRADWAHGTCGEFFRDRRTSRSLVYAAPDPLHDQHWLSQRDDVRREILRYLAAR